MTRGMLNDKAQSIAKKTIKRKITQIELRLMPYLQYQMMNEQKIDPRRINSEDREVLALWKKEGHIEGGASGLGITKFFWDFINQVLFETYVSGD